MQSSLKFKDLEITTMLRRSTLTLILVTLLGPSLARAEATQHDELTVAVVKKALRGWELYRAKNFAAAFKDGQYTDPDPQTRSRDFWSNGRYAILDRDGNGHHETVFVVEHGELVYVGSIGQRGQFVDVSHRYEALKGQKIAAFVEPLATTD